MFKDIIIFGGSGFIGKSLIKHFNDLNIIPIVVSRTTPSSGEFIHFKWITNDKVSNWEKHLTANTTIINLIGRSVDCMKTPKTIDEILRSRVDSTKYIGQTLQRISTKPKHWIQMSTAHIYGDSEELLSEDSTIGLGLAPDIGRAWEKTFHQYCPASVDKTILRTSFVIGRNGGAFSILKRLTKFGLGGKIGNGHQGMSWIHQHDFNFLITEIIKRQWTGVIIASAPNPISNKQFMATLRKSLNMPFGFPSPSCLIYLASKTFLNIDPEIALYGRYVRSRVLDENGYKFKYPILEEAIRAI